MGRAQLVVAVAVTGLIPGASATAATGGVAPSPPPLPDAITCQAGCGGMATALRGGVVRVGGDLLGQVTQVVFLGHPGRADDVVAPAEAVTAASADAHVPPKARSGPLRLVNADGRRSRRTSTPLKVVSRIRTPRGAGPHVDTLVAARRVYYGAERHATLSYIVLDAVPSTVVVDLVRAQDGATVARWGPGVVAPRTVQTIDWDGTANGKIQPEGRYAFRIGVAEAGDGAHSSQAATETLSAFEFKRHAFPVLGPHSFGDAIARFGAPREGHTHEGQDVFADCGTPLVAARGGIVKLQTFEKDAGNYVVIDGDGTGVDYVYMHLRDPALVRKGDHVFTGQQLGFVGDTGDAVGCHLHFEMWSSPGWYSGGAPFDPLPFLQDWDAGSPAGAG